MTPFKASINGKNAARILFKRCFSHVPVMAQELTRLMQPEDGKVYIDMTFGAGGHSKCLLDTNKSITIVAVDRDPAAFEKAQELARSVAIKSEKLGIMQKVIPIHGKFSSVSQKIHLHGIPYGSVDGVIFDLGASSLQYDDPQRGFAISHDGKLDMRMDTSDENALTAEDVINNSDLRSLIQIFKIYGEERRSSKVANSILDARALIGRIKTTSELSRIIQTSRRPSKDALGRHAHPGTKIFQAIRIFVNNELNELNYALKSIREFLQTCKDPDDNNCQASGVAAVLTFHSLEDKIVKKHFNNIDPDEPNFKVYCQVDRIETRYSTDLEEVTRLGQPIIWKPLFKHVIRPSSEEIMFNPRARSAKLRAAVRV